MFCFVYYRYAAVVVSDTIIYPNLISQLFGCYVVYIDTSRDRGASSPEHTCTLAALS
jgi:hypothetical protein